MNILKAFKQAVFGIKNQKRKSYNSLVQELIEYEDERIDLISDIGFLSEKVGYLKAEIANYETENQKATKRFNDMYKIMVPKLSDTQLYELYEIIDPEGWMLLKIVTNLTKTNTNNLYYEDNMGTFENLNGNQLIWWHEKMAFGEAEYEIISGTCCEKTNFKELDETKNEYMEYMKNRTNDLRNCLTSINFDCVNTSHELINDGLMFLVNKVSTVSI